MRRLRLLLAATFLALPLFAAMAPSSAEAAGTRQERLQQQRRAQATARQGQRTHTAQARRAKRQQAHNARPNRQQVARTSRRARTNAAG